MGSRPQAVINRQIVDDCDMAVAVFWTRLGTPTGEAESGTAEEISRMGNDGKPVMLYFSQAKVPLRDLDISEYQRLAEFQKQTYPKGLIENYSTPGEFRDKFRRQLAFQISSIITTDIQRQDESTVDTHGIELSFASAPSIGAPMPVDVLELTKIICTDKSEIPDYIDYGTEPVSYGSNLSIVTATATPNRNFYREVVAYAERIALRSQLRLVVSSASNQSMRDIHLDIEAHTRNGHVLINPPALSWPSPQQQYLLTNIFTQDPLHASMQIPGQVTVRNISEDEWRMEADVPVVQAQRTVYLTGFFTVAATEDSNLVFDATVYSSDALPFALSTELKVRVKEQEMSYHEILREMVPGYGERTR